MFTKDAILKLCFGGAQYSSAPLSTDHSPARMYFLKFFTRLLKVLLLLCCSSFLFPYFLKSFWRLLKNPYHLPLRDTQHDWRTARNQTWAMAMSWTQCQCQCQCFSEALINANSFFSSLSIAISMSMSNVLAQCQCQCANITSVNDLPLFIESSLKYACKLDWCIILLILVRTRGLIALDYGQNWQTLMGFYPINIEPTKGQCQCQFPQS